MFFKDEPEYIRKARKQPAKTRTGDRSTVTPPRLLKGQHRGSQARKGV